MKTGFIADGESRRERSPEVQARLHGLHEAIQARYAAELAKAGVLRRMILRWRIASEFRRERRKLEPSPGSLYSNQAAGKGD